MNVLVFETQVSSDGIPEQLTNQDQTALEVLATEPDVTAYLEQPGVNKHEYLYPLRKLTPESILGVYGTKALVWLCANNTHGEYEQSLAKAIDTYTPYDAEQIHQAAVWEWFHRMPVVSLANVLDHHEVMSALRGGILEDIDLPRLLDATRNTDQPMSDKRMNDYALTPLHIQPGRHAMVRDTRSGRIDGWFGPGGDRFYDAWLDAPSGFGLTYKNKLQAITAVAPGNKDELVVHQLQGVQPYGYSADKGRDKSKRYSTRGLAPLTWRSLMIGATAELAQNLCKDVVVIRNGDSNLWTRQYDGELSEEVYGQTRKTGVFQPHLSISAARRTYDKPARELGFESIPKGWKLAADQIIANVIAGRRAG